MLSKVGTAIGAAAVWAIASSAALAQESGPSLHGFADLSVKTDYITPRGLHVVDDGATIQYLQGLVLAWDKVSLVGGIWADFNPGYKAPNTESFNEFDWFVGADYKITDKLKVGVQYVEFISPQNAFDTEKNLEFSASYSDGLEPISINPYAKLFWAIDGDSTVVLGKQGDTFDVEIGAVPTMKFDPGNFPLVVSAPTWITVGPEEYWGGDENFGVFSTGLKVSHPLGFMPKAAGNWSIYGGYQHYFFINDNLQAARTILTSKTGKDDGIWSLGLSMGF